MNVLLDECLPKKLKREVNGDVVKTVPEMGWGGKKNEVLLQLAEQKFDVLLTNDHNLEYQQNLKSFNLAVIVLAARTNDIEDLRPLMPAANEALRTIRAGEIVHIEATSG